MHSLGTRTQNRKSLSVKPAQQNLSRRNTRSAGTRRVAGTTIAFVASSDSITDSGDGLAGFQVGDTIHVSGSASNDGEYRVKTVAAGALTVFPELVDESATLAIEIRTL